MTTARVLLMSCFRTRNLSRSAWSSSRVIWKSASDMAITLETGERSWFAGRFKSRCPMAAQTIKITGARQHNLKNLTLEIPRERLVVITGMSGSGKSSLAFDTLYAEGQRRYVESLSAYARQFLDQMEKPDVDFIEGLSPAIAIEQRSSGGSPRS